MTLGDRVAKVSKKDKSSSKMNKIVDSFVFNEILKFLPRDKLLELQLVNRYFYEKKMPEHFKIANRTFHCFRAKFKEFT